MPDAAKRFAAAVPASRVLVNTPAALGGIGATTCLFPALTPGVRRGGRLVQLQQHRAPGPHQHQAGGLEAKELEERGEPPRGRICPCAVDESLLNELVNPDYREA